LQIAFFGFNGNFSCSLGQYLVHRTEGYDSQFYGSR
jgi:hypothetical protein